MYFVRQRAFVRPPWKPFIINESKSLRALLEHKMKLVKTEVNGIKYICEIDETDTIVAVYKEYDTSDDLMTLVKLENIIDNEVV